MTKSQTVAERTAMEIAAQFARAYADGDDERLRDLVTADVLEREINPSGYVEFRGPDELIAERRAFTGHYGEPEVLELTTESAGPLVRVINRWRHNLAGTTGLCDFYELLRIEDGRVAQIDLICSGVAAEPEARG